MNMKDGKKILVTGDAGLVKSHTAEHYTKREDGIN